MQVLWYKSCTTWEVEPPNYPPWSLEPTYSITKRNISFKKVLGGDMLVTRRVTDQRTNSTLTLPSLSSYNDHPIAVFVDEGIVKLHLLSNFPVICWITMDNSTQTCWPANLADLSRQMCANKQYMDIEYPCFMNILDETHLFVSETSQVWDFRSMKGYYGYPWFKILLTGVISLSWMESL